MIHVGDCLQIMRRMQASSVDSIVTDPPYGIGFMGKAWDGKDIEARMEKRRSFASQCPTAGPNGGHKSAAAAAGKYDLTPKGMRAFQDFSAEWGVEALRVAKPGAYLVAFASPRTFHRLVCGLEEAGWEIRDTLMWVFGSGFPKSHNGPWGGTALKPAWEPIVLARKPLGGTVAANWREHGTGALNIDACRVDGAARPAREVAAMRDGVKYSGNALSGRADGSLQSSKAVGETTLGRWPANLLHDGSEEVLFHFPSAPGQQGDLTGQGPSGLTRNAYGEFNERRVFKARRDGEASADRRYTGAGSTNFAPLPGMRREHPGSAARFFYCAKASRKDRNDGCEGLEARPLNWSSGSQSPGTFQSEGTRRASENNHPTVKPTELMRWLCRLVTPPGGLVLDPFAGSGSTGRGAIAEGFRFQGIELDPDYAAIAEARIRAVAPGLSLRRGKL